MISQKYYLLGDIMPTINYLDNTPQYSGLWWHHKFCYSQFKRPVSYFKLSLYTWVRVGMVEGMPLMIKRFCLQIPDPDTGNNDWSLNHWIAHQRSDHCKIKCTLMHLSGPKHWPRGARRKMLGINCLMWGNIITGQVMVSCWNSSDKDNILLKHKHSTNY